MIRRFAGLPRDRRGAAAMEFAIVAPVFVTLMVGAYDVVHMEYARSVLSGAVERAGRVGALESGGVEAADAIVEAEIAPVLPGYDIDSERTSYYDFADIDQPEPFQDGNDNDVCDDGETYSDRNNNDQWDADAGNVGNGGANDVVVYTVSVSYPPLFKIPVAGLDHNRTLTAKTIHRNQPFASSPVAAAGTCDE